MDDLIERIKGATQTSANVSSRVIPAELLQEIITALESNGWVSVDEGGNPDKSGEYFVVLVDDREEDGDIWYEALTFEKRQAFPDRWWTSDFDRVTHYKLATPPK